MIAIELPARADISSWLHVSVPYSGTAQDICLLYATYLQATSTWQSEHVTRMTERMAVLGNSNCAIACNK
jgi:hypothetical protein